MRPTITLTAAIGLIDAIAARGGDPDEVLRSVGVRRAAIANPHGVIVCSDFARLLEAAARATGDDCFGLHFGEQYQPKNIGPLTYVMLHSPTFAGGIQSIARYLRVHNEAAQVSVAIEGQWAYIRHQLTDLTIEAPRQLNEYSVVVGLNTIRLMAGLQWAPAEAQFAHPAPRETTEHTRVFRAPVSFGRPTNALVVEAEFLDRQVPAADERLYQILTRYLDGVLKEMPREEGLLATVRRAVGESLPDGEPKLTQVAGQLATTPRTLQRRLREHGLDFRRLVDDTRRRFSLNYLKDPKHTLTEIAYLVGYSEVSAFNRAFRRWTGATPSGYRRKIDE